MPLCSLTDGPENQAVEHNEGQNGDEDQNHRIDDQHIISRVLQVVANFRWPNLGI